MRCVGSRPGSSGRVRSRGVIRRLRGVGQRPVATSVQPRPVADEAVLVLALGENTDAVGASR